MLNEALRIYVERLRDHAETIDEVVPADFIGVDEAALAFRTPVTIKGEAYLAENELVLNLTASTTAEMPCAICNGTVSLPVEARIMHMEPIDHFKRGVYDMSEVIREALLLEIPLTAEHNAGHCPEREAIKKYLKKEGDKDGDDGEGGYHPFSDLNIEDN